MNRRDFLKLAGAGLIGTMFPKVGNEKMNNMNNKFGDRLGFLLRQYDARLEDIVRRWPRESLPPSFAPVMNTPEAADLVRELNELSDRDDKYRTWLQDGTSKVSSSAINFPMELIYSNVLAADTQTITIRIPSCYNSLMFMANGRTDQTGVILTGIQMLINSDTGNNYYHQEFQAYSTGHDASQSFPNGSAVVGYFSADDAEAGASNSFWGWMPGIQTDLWKYVYSLSGVGKASAENALESFRMAAWTSTDKVISLSFRDDDTNNLVQGAYFGVYGIR